MNEIIDNLKNLNAQLPEDYNSEVFFNNLLSNLFNAIDSSKNILIYNSGSDVYARLKHNLNEIVNESEIMNKNFYEYSFESKRKLAESIYQEFEYLNTILETHFIKTGNLSEYWRYDYPKPDIYRAFRQQLVIDPKDGSILPVINDMHFGD